MAKNKYPEETKNLIVETAFRLFMEKGYDHTSIQDIIDRLGGLSKGAIYYHFKSKEEILWEVAGQLYGDQEKAFREICRRTDLNGKEKLKAILSASLNDKGQDKMMVLAPDMLKNPQLLAFYLENTVLEEVPVLICGVLEEGIRDGSIRTEYPKQLAEVMMIVSNIWMNPMICHIDAQEVVNRMRFFQHMLKLFGLDVIDEEMIQRMGNIVGIYNAE